MTKMGERPGILAVLAVAGLLTVVMVRVASEARSELAVASAYRDEGRIARAIEHYRRALRWSFPLSPYTPRAASALESLAEELEKASDLPGALGAWRSLSGGLAASRSLYLRTSRRREKANEHIARLLAMQGGAAIDAGLSPAQLEASHLRLLREAVSPDPWWSTLLLMGMAIWVSACVIVAKRGFDSTGRFDWASARGVLWVGLAGFATFTLGLLFA